MYPQAMTDRQPAAQQKLETEPQNINSRAKRIFEQLCLLKDCLDQAQEKVYGPKPSESKGQATQSCVCVMDMLSQCEAMSHSLLRDAENVLNSL